MRFPSLLLAFVASLVPALIGTSHARACSIDTCSGIAILPRGTPSDPAHLPANALAISVQRLSVDGPATLEVTRMRGGDTVVVLSDDAPTGTILLTDVEAGDVLNLRLTDTCPTSTGSYSATSVILVAPGAALPTDLGIVVAGPAVRGDVDVWDNRGSCTSPIASSRADYALALSDEALPFADALEVTVTIDGVAHVARSVDEASGLIFHACVAPLPSQVGFADWAEGEHVIGMRAVVRGTDTEIPARDATVSLHCSGGAAGGCSVDPSRAGSSALAAAAMLAMAVWVGRRRRAV